MAKKTTTKLAAAKEIVTLKHDEASRKNIPTAEFESVMQPDQQSPLRVAYERRNRDLDPQLVWRGKDEQDWSDLWYPRHRYLFQKKVHPKVLIDDLKRQSDASRLAAQVLRSPLALRRQTKPFSCAIHQLRSRAMAARPVDSLASVFRAACRPRSAWHP